MYNFLLFLYKMLAIECYNAKTSSLATRLQESKEERVLKIE